MITIDFSLSQSWNTRTKGASLACVDETVLRYDVFLGDIIFKVDRCDFSATWGWIPLIDFAASLRQIVDELVAKDGAERLFEFTESDATLRFKRGASTVIISASYAPGTACISLIDFAAAADGFSRRIVETISQEYPSLLQNGILCRLLPVPSTES